MKVKTYSPKDFKEYCKRVDHWIKQFNITGWVYSFEHTQLETACAQVCYNMVARNAVFMLTTSQDNSMETYEDMNYLALHEVIHLLLANLLFVTASTSSDNNNPIVQASEHEVIHQLCQFLLKAK